MKKVVLIVVAILILLAIPATVFLVSQRQELRKRAAPATTLSLAPPSITKKVGEKFTLEVKIDTGENQVVSAEINLAFDPDKLAAGTIKNGPLFPNVLTDGVVGRGTASIQIGATSTSQPVTGTGTAATFEFTPLAQTDTPISVRFASSTFVGGLGETSANVLVGTTPAKVTITDASGQTTGANEASGSALVPTPTLSPGEESSTSGQASSSAVLIVTPTKNTSVASDQPTITGKAPPGATVTITIYSDPITATVTADANGNWSYTPVTPLVSGTHSVVASAADPVTGQTQTSSSSFVVAGGNGASSSESATPVSGTVENTLILLGLGTLLFLSGLLFPIFAKR